MFAYPTIPIPSEVSPVEDRKYIVFESCLKTLFMNCSICHASCQVKISHFKGTLVVFVSTCAAGHTRTWHSQPLHKKMPLGNLLTAAGIFFSGASPTKALNSHRHINLKTFSLRSYYQLQEAYLLPSVRSLWQSHQDDLVQKLNGKTLSLGGDGRCCSPGHTAQFGSYSLMDLESKQVLDVQLVQVISLSHYMISVPKSKYNCLNF